MNSILDLKNKCIFCGEFDLSPLNVDKKIYWYCSACRGVFLDGKFFLDADSEKKRYQKHNNSLEIPQYRRYLEAFFESIYAFPAVSEEKDCMLLKIHDYGSGPEPALARLLEQKGYQVRYNDLYFSPALLSFEGGADLVTCLEVAEHFKEPKTDFAMMNACLRPGGFLAIGTHLIDEKPQSGTMLDFFQKWWYRQDETHITFYSELSLRIVAQAAGFKWLGRAGSHVFLFKKIP